MPKSTHNLYWFKEVGKDDVGIVGGKGANLGEMTQAHFPVPPGFIISAKAYFQFIKDHNLATRIDHLLKTADFERPDSLLSVSNHIKKIIMQEDMDEELIHEIYHYYRSLSSNISDPLVAVRSSATAEDLPTASFAGQQETFLNVKGDANLIQKVKEAWASLFEPRAIFYRHEQKFDHFRVGIAIVVQQMVESEISGIMFTIDPVTNDKSTAVIEAVYGLGEYIVQGKVTPDHYEVDKKNLEVKKVGVVTQDVMYIREKGKNVEKKLSERVGKRQKLTHNQMIALTVWGQKLEKHYFFPQDIEWAIAGSEIYIVQTRAITTTHTKQAAKQEEIHLPLLLTGAPASPGISSGPVRILKSAHDMGKVKPGDVLVAPQTNPDYVPAMKKAAAIVTEKGGRTSHAAIVSRELGTPAVVGAENATRTLKEDMIVTVNGTTGEIYKGGFTASHSIDTEVHPNIKTATKVYVNLAEPELAEKIGKRHVDGIGLLRAEFMMAGIGTHPKKLIHDGKRHVFINTLADQLEQFCKAFYPRPVVYRASDFKTNEYRNLIGGKAYEPVESNPMLGYRGAFRYIHDPQVFELELEAIKKVRNQKNLKNLWMMVPFVRNVSELKEVKRIITKSGLVRSPLFKLWMMVEIPSNVILLEEFLKVGIDGISIGSNDLTMLILGTDRDNSEVAREFDERNPAVLWALEHAIKTARKHGATASICGQAPSLYPDLLEKLVKWGVTSVSVSPDVIDSTRETIAKIEKNMLR